MAAIGFGRFLESDALRDRSKQFLAECIRCCGRRLTRQDVVQMDKNDLVAMLDQFRAQPQRSNQWHALMTLVVSRTRT